MDVQAISSVTGATPTTMTSPPPSPQLNGTLDGIAQSLSMTSDALRGSLAQGASITDLAQQKGVSRSDLVNQVESQIQQSRQARGLQPLDQTTLDRMVNRAFDRHRHHRGSATQAPADTNAAQASTTATAQGTTIDTVA